MANSTFEMDYRIKCMLHNGRPFEIKRDLYCVKKILIDECKCNFYAQIEDINH